MVSVCVPSRRATRHVEQTLKGVGEGGGLGGSGAHLTTDATRQQLHPYSEL